MHNAFTVSFLRVHDRRRATSAAGPLRESRDQEHPHGLTGHVAAEGASGTGDMGRWGCPCWIATWREPCRRGKSADWSSGDASGRRHAHCAKRTPRISSGCSVPRGTWAWKHAARCTHGKLYTLQCFAVICGRSRRRVGLSVTCAFTHDGAWRSRHSATTRRTSLPKCGTRVITTTCDERSAMEQRDAREVASVRTRPEVARMRVVT